jgi:hypothetical protein
LKSPGIRIDFCDDAEGGHGNTSFTYMKNLKVANAATYTKMAKPSPI